MIARGALARCATFVVALSWATAPAQTIPGFAQVTQPAPRDEAPAPALTPAQARAQYEDAQRAHVALQARASKDPELAQALPLSRRLLTLLAGRVTQAQALADPSAGLPLESDAEFPGLRGAPPYPLLQVDALRDRRDALRAQAKSIELSLQTLADEFEGALAAKREADQAVRMHSESTGRDGEAAAAAESRRVRELARLRARVADANLATLDGARTLARRKLERIGERLEACERELQRIGPAVRMTSGDLVPLEAAIESERERIGREIEALDARLSRRVERRDALAGTRADERDGAGMPTTARRPRDRRALADELRALDAEIDADRTGKAVLVELAALERGKLDAWRRRLIDEATDDAARGGKESPAARGGELSRALEQIGARERLAREQLETARAVAGVQQSAIERLPAGAPERATELRILDARRQDVDHRARSLAALDAYARLLTRSREDVASGTRHAGLAGGLRHGLDRALLGLSGLWSYELFSATETMQVDGRTVTIDYGVTVGKSVGVLLLFALGYGLASWAARRATQTAVRHFGVRPQVARVIRRWVMSIVAVAILVIVLKLARVPLTVFAFMGGALAIGIGFGTQNIIKNLISGAIILVERKIRVGDIVTIGAVSGTVTAVDLRATTLMGFDGIESMIPNSTLLEQSVNNWTHQDASVRRAVRVGLQEARDARRAAALLEACARAHPGVLPQPAPQAVFDDFGSDEATMQLLFWTRVGAGRSWRSVESDLRFAFADALAGAGIELASPQRTIRMAGATKRPIAQVRFSRSRRLRSPGPARRGLLRRPQSVAWPSRG